MNLLVLSMFSPHMLISFGAILVHALTVRIACLFVMENDIWPPAYQPVAVVVLELLMVLLVHLIHTRIGFWYVETIVVMES